ncbi:MAG TPA: response regulator transcription factor, partial [Microlunatus sp.]
DFTAALALHDDIVTAMRVVNGPHFIGQVRLSGVLLDVLTGAVSAGRPVDGLDLPMLAGRALEARDAAREALADFERSRRPGPEAYAWQARTEAEYLRFTERIGRGATDRAEQIRAWQRAVDGFTDYPHVFERARSQARLAAVLATGDRSERAAAEDLMKTAAETATRLGARQLLTELGGPPRSTSAGETDGNPLTSREREVLDLVAEGLSNRDIGVRLVISTKTASVHVSNIMGKLGAESRTEAVAIARRSGLLA